MPGLRLLSRASGNECELITCKDSHYNQVTMKIALDAVGGDFYPANPVSGAISAVAERQDLHIILLGPKELVENELTKQNYTGNRISVVDAPQIIGMDESPAVAVKSKQNSSIAIGLTMHQKGLCDAFVSAGNTGALLAASVFILGKLPGVSRPAIGSTYPSVHGNKFMLDVGANTDVKPETLVQFGLMGKVFTRYILGIENPKIGLLNVGEEEEKGRELTRKTYELLKDRPDFAGNMEGRDILKGKADVYICDGFTGNLLLKLGETIPEAIGHIVKQTMIKKGLTTEQMQLVGGILKESFMPFDYQLVGGVPFLGVNGNSLVGHGGSPPLAIKNMIFTASKMVEKQVNKHITNELN